MKKLTLLLTLAASFTIGQSSEPKKLTGRDAARAEDIVKTMPLDTKTASMPGVIIKAPGFNGREEIIGFAFKNGGEMVFQGTKCWSEDTVKMGAYQLFESDYPQYWQLLDVSGRMAASPGEEPLCKIAATRADGKSGSVSARIGSDSEGPVFTVRDEVIDENGNYLLYLTGVSPDATVVIGTNYWATKVRYEIGNYTVVSFDKELLSVKVGPLIVTVCQKGTCNTKVFDHRLISPTTSRQKG